MENFKGYIPFSSWSSFDLRVEANTHRILDLLDGFAFNPKATFFILGWIAKRVPGLVLEIHDRGHEVASHGVSHHLCTLLSLSELSEDLSASRKFLEDLTGEGVYGYRAPSFAVNNQILNLIHQAGYLYDSSYNSFAMHGRYGRLDFSQSEKLGTAFKPYPDFFELPVSNLNIGKQIFPLGGGGYFRLLPFQLFKQGMNAVLTKDDAFVFYSHPWEFDPDQPRVKQATKGVRFRHYTNLARTRKKFHSLIDSFPWCEFPTCKNYIGNILNQEPK